MEVVELDKHSGAIKRVVRELEVRRDRLRVLCGRGMNLEPAVDQLMTAGIRGQIKELSLLIKEFSTGQEGQESVSRPVESE